MPINPRWRSDIILSLKTLIKCVFRRVSIRLRAVRLLDGNIITIWLNVCQYSIHDEPSEICSVAIQYKIIIVLIIYNIRYDNNYLQTVHNINNLIMHFGEYTIHCIRLYTHIQSISLCTHRCDACVKCKLIRSKSVQNKMAA